MNKICLYSFLHGYSGSSKPRERKKRDPLEQHTEPLAPLFVEKPENMSAKEGNQVTTSYGRLVSSFCYFDNK